MKRIIKIKAEDGNWKSETIDGIRFEAKVYDEKSEYGINNGNVSKLSISGVADYDRGWNKRPKTSYEKQLVKELLEYFKENKK